MTKLDMKREYRDLYSPKPDHVSEIDVPPLSYLMVDGHGDPNGPMYAQAMATLYPVAYTLKFALKPDHDFVVGPLEGLWWDDTPDGFDMSRRDRWQWTSMIVQPGFVTAAHLDDAIAAVGAKGSDAPLLGQVRLDTLDEGRCVQIMHLGPYSAEGPTIERLHGYMAERGLVHRGRHHEIYLSDPRRVAPEKMKTVIRQPVA